MSAPKPLDRAALETAFTQLGQRALAEGLLVELAVYGGSAMLLTLDARIATRDVDAVFDQDREFVRRVAAEIAQEQGWSADWLNDGVKGFLSARDRDPDAKQLFRSYPSQDRPGLRVLVPTPAYLFAMKCLATRIGSDETDLGDVRIFARTLGLKTAAEACDVIERFYPRIRTKTRFALEELLGHETGPAT
jgi:hypothetical protein